MGYESQCQGEGYVSLRPHILQNKLVYILQGRSKLDNWGGGGADMRAKPESTKIFYGNREQVN